MMKNQLCVKAIPPFSTFTTSFTFVLCCGLILSAHIAPSFGGRVVVHDDDAETRRPYPPDVSHAIVEIPTNGTTGNDPKSDDGILVDPINSNTTKQLPTPEEVDKKPTNEPTKQPTNENENIQKGDQIDRFLDDSAGNSLSACGWVSNMLGVSGTLFVNSTSNGYWMSGMVPDENILSNLTYTTSVFGAANGAIKRGPKDSGDSFRVEIGYVFADIGGKVDLKFVPLFDRMMVEVVASPNIRVLPMHVHGAPFSQCHSVWNFLIEYSNATQRDVAWRKTINAVSGVTNNETSITDPDAPHQKIDEGLRIPHSIPEAIDMVKRGVQKIQNNLSQIIHRFTDADHHHDHTDHHAHHHHRDHHAHHHDDRDQHHRHAGGASASDLLPVVGHKISPFRTSFVFVSAVEAEGSLYVAAEVRGCIFPDKPPNMIEVTGPLTGYGCSASLCGWTVVGNNDGHTNEERSSWVAYGGPMNMNFTTQWSQQEGWNLTVVPMHSYGGESLTVNGPHFAHIFASSAPDFDVFNAIITRIV